VGDLKKEDFHARQSGGSVWKSNVIPNGISSTYEELSGAEKQAKEH
jgi:hypothetical protein